MKIILSVGKPIVNQKVTKIEKFNIFVILQKSKPKLPPTLLSNIETDQFYMPKIHNSICKLLTSIKFMEKSPI